MTTIRLHCRSCGTTELAPADLVVVNLASGASELLYRCCHIDQTALIAQLTVAVLVSVGVETVDGSALPVKVQNAIHIDDVPTLTDFRQELAGVSTPGDIRW